MEYTLLSMIAPSPASAAELKEAVAQRTCAVVFRRYIKNDARARTRDVLPALDPADVDAELSRMLEAGLIVEDQPAPDAEGPFEGDAARWYSLTDAGRERFLGWVFKVWPVDPYEIPAEAKTTESAGAGAD